MNSLSHSCERNISSGQGDADGAGPTSGYCPEQWDGFTCWPTSPPNTTVYMPCPEHIIMTLKGRIVTSGRQSFRRCGLEGAWQSNSMGVTWSNYSACLEYLNHHLSELDGDGRGFGREGTGTGNATTKAFNQEDDIRALVLRDIYFFGNLASFILLSVTLFIFLYFKSLQCSRISIHKHLVTSFLLKSVTIIIMFEPFISGRKSFNYRNVQWLCKTMNVLQNYFVMANVFWTLVEGLYLHNRVAVCVFDRQAPFKVFYTIGWGIPVLFVGAWTIAMYIFYDNSKFYCWNYWSANEMGWLVIGPIIVSLLINMIFLCNIIRILITKLHHNSTAIDSKRIKKAVKATVILFPLLGLTNLLFFMPVTYVEGTLAIKVYRYTNAISQASQGIFIAIIYCFLNAEVRKVICKRYLRYKARRLGRHLNRRRASRTTSLIMMSTSDYVHNSSTNGQPRLKMKSHVQFKTARTPLGSTRVKYV